MQNRNRIADTESVLMVARWEGVCGEGGKGEGIKKYKLVVTEQSRGCEVQRREDRSPKNIHK